MTTSRYGVVVDHLVAACQALPVFADPARVYDGPFTGGDTNWTNAVFVGFDGDWREVASGQGAGANYESGVGTQAYEYVGNIDGPRERRSPLRRRIVDRRIEPANWSATRRWPCGPGSPA